MNSQRIEDRRHHAWFQLQTPATKDEDAGGNGAHQALREAPGRIVRQLQRRGERLWLVYKGAYGGGRARLMQDRVQHPLKVLPRAAGDTARVMTERARSAFDEGRLVCSNVSDASTFTRRGVCRPSPRCSLLILREGPLLRVNRCCGRCCVVHPSRFALEHRSARGPAPGILRHRNSSLCRQHASGSDSLCTLYSLLAHVR